jgi:hypothetical protein
MTPTNHRSRRRFFLATARSLAGLFLFSSLTEEKASAPLRRCPGVSARRRDASRYRVCLLYLLLICGHVGALQISDSPGPPGDPALRLTFGPVLWRGCPRRRSPRPGTSR